MSVNRIRERIQRLHTGNAGGDDDDIGASEGVLQSIVLGQVPSHDLSHSVSLYAMVQVSTHGRSGNVRDVGSDTGCVDDIVKSELRDGLVRLEQEGQWLAVC
jgi:hypothetical protein